MWKLKVLIALLLPFTVKSKSTQITAISQVISELFVKTQIEADILLIGKATNRSHDIVNELQGNFVHELKVVRNSSNLKIEKSAIFIYNGLEDLRKILTQTDLTNSSPKKLRFLGIDERKFNSVRDFDGQLNFKQSLNYRRGPISQFFYLLVPTLDDVNFLTFNFFNENFCAESKLELLNSFNLKSQNWTNALKIPQKFHNLNNCTLISLANNEYFVKSKLGVFHKIFIGYIFDAVAQIGNFTVAPMWYREVEALEEKTKGLFAPHLYITTRIITKYHKKFHHSMAFYDCIWNFLITPGEEYSSYEKILLPFDKTTWICLLTTFLIAFFTIFIISRLRSTYQDIVFGNGISIPSLNVVSSFFGISQKKLPEKNFARSLLVLFVMFCLIFRTAYQGYWFLY